MKVYIAVGHGQRDNGTFDPGAVGGGWSEQSAGDIVVAEAAHVLRSAGLDVKDEANKDDPNYTGTVRAANNWGADVLVAVHHDWSGAPSGSFGFWVSDKGKQVADAIQKAVGNAGFPLRSSWHKYRDNLYVLNSSNMPATLYECGKIGQEELDTEPELRKMGNAIARGIMDWAGVEATDVPSEREENDLLKRGDEGPQVAYFQRRLIDCGDVMGKDLLPKFGADADFGGETEDAVKAVQDNVGFPQTGVIDMATATYIQALAHSGAKTSNGLTREEADGRYARRGSRVSLTGKLP